VVRAVKDWSVLFGNHLLDVLLHVPFLKGFVYYTTRDDVVSKKKLEMMAFRIPNGRRVLICHRQRAAIVV
jgi:hypothetical protein